MLLLCFKPPAHKRVNENILVKGQGTNLLSNVYFFGQVLSIGQFFKSSLPTYFKIGSNIRSKIG